MLQLLRLSSSMMIPLELPGFNFYREPTTIVRLNEIDFTLQDDSLTNSFRLKLYRRVEVATVTRGGIDEYYASFYNGLRLRPTVKRIIKWWTLFKLVSRHNGHPSIDIRGRIDLTTFLRQNNIQCTRLSYGGLRIHDKRQFLNNFPIGEWSLA